MAIMFDSLYGNAVYMWQVYANNMRVVTVKRESLAHCIANRLVDAGYSQVFVKGV